MSSLLGGPENGFPHYFLKRSFRSSVSEAMDRATLISFDVFDTLLRRPFLEPFHAFEALGREAGRERIWAEEAARYRHGNQSDVTLEQIYALLCYPADIELELERELLYPRAEIGTWLKLATAKRKKIVAVSDMYLPHAFISDVLRKCGIAVDDLIVSSHDGVTKMDGSAYRLLSERHHVPFPEILHFGDNPHADYKMPKRMGIASVLVADKIPRNAENHHISSLVRTLARGTPGASAVGAILRDSLVNDGLSSFWIDIGRFIAAPLMVSFAQWARSQAEHAGIDRLAFSARDGKMPREVFLALYGDSPIKAPYVHLSRAVVMRSALGSLSPTIRKQLTTGAAAPVSNYVSRIGEGSATLLEKAHLHFRGDPLVGNDIKISDLDDFFRSSQQELAAISAVARPLLYRYLEQQNLLHEPNKVAVADIGWNGTVASLLRDVVPESRSWTWLYFGTLKEFQPPEANHRAMFFTYGVPAAHRELVLDCTEIVEFLFSAPEPSTVGLHETPSGAILPVLAPTDSQWKGWAPRAKQIGEGIAAMMPTFMRRAASTQGLVIDRDTVSTLISHIMHTDDRSVITEFGQLQHQLGLGASAYEPLLPEAHFVYWKNIWRLLKGRNLKPSKEKIFWRRQQKNVFLLGLSGPKLALARYAFRVNVKRKADKSTQRARRKTFFP